MLQQNYLRWQYGLVIGVFIGLVAGVVGYVYSPYLAITLWIGLSLIAILSYSYLVAKSMVEAAISSEDLHNVEEGEVQFSEPHKLSAMAQRELARYYNGLDGVHSNSSAPLGPYATGLHHGFYATALALYQTGDETVTSLIDSKGNIAEKNMLFCYLQKKVPVPIPEQTPTMAYGAEDWVQNAWQVKYFEAQISHNFYRDLATPIILRLWKGKSAIHHIHSAKSVSLSGDGNQIWLWGLEGYKRMQVPCKDKVAKDNPLSKAPVTEEEYQYGIIQQFIIGRGDDDRMDLWYHPTKQTLLCGDWQGGWPNPREDKSLKISSLSLFSNVKVPFTAVVRQWARQHIQVQTLRDFFSYGEEKFCLQLDAMKAMIGRIELLHGLLDRQASLSPHQLYQEYEACKTRQSLK